MQASEQPHGEPRAADSDWGSIALSAQSSNERSASPASRPLRTVRFADESQSERYGSDMGGAMMEASMTDGHRPADRTSRSLLRWGHAVH